MGKQKGKDTAEADAAAIAKQQEMEHTQGDGLTEAQIRGINKAGNAARERLGKKK